MRGEHAGVFSGQSAAWHTHARQIDAPAARPQCYGMLVVGRHAYEEVTTIRATEHAGIGLAVLDVDTLEDLATLAHTQHTRARGCHPHAALGVEADAIGYGAIGEFREHAVIAKSPVGVAGPGVQPEGSCRR